MTQVTYTATSSNTKTGSIPQIWIGKSVAEAKKSCDTVACPMRPWVAEKGEALCYAFSGSSVLGFTSATRNLNQLTLEQALARRTYSAKAIRVGAIGDPAALPIRWWNTLRRMAEREKLKVLSYTHGWRQRPDLVGRTMASCDSLEEVAEAKAMGFQAAVVLHGWDAKQKRFPLPDGGKGLVCPNMYMKAIGKIPVTCNDCLKCDGANPELVIGFPAHDRVSLAKKGK